MSAYDSRKGTGIGRIWNRTEPKKVSMSIWLRDVVEPIPNRTVKVPQEDVFKGFTWGNIFL